MNVSSDGILNTLRERPIQYGFWTIVNWRGMQINWPVGLADPQMDFMKEVVDPLTGARYTPRLVFQVQYPTPALGGSMCSSGGTAISTLSRLRTSHRSSISEARSTRISGTHYMTSSWWTSNTNSREGITTITAWRLSC
ncbi:MAG: hypothetical protein QXL98_04155 [Thermofilaceae archaeon]